MSLVVKQKPILTRLNDFLPHTHKRQYLRTRFIKTLVSHTVYYCNVTVWESLVILNPAAVAFAQPPLIHKLLESVL